MIRSPREISPASSWGGIGLRLSCNTVDMLSTAGTERADRFVCWGGCGGHRAGKGEYWPTVLSAVDTLITAGTKIVGRMIAQVFMWWGGC